ncbi:M15 family metallopeptidase [Streptomyces sp. NPDC057307]|uniref:M15 family metallopeptidase n=1 Tax=Streptomyces sp. NPDC057307 TaxID=3346096 RepID=UPI003643CA28
MDRPLETAGHVSGAAVDRTIRTKDGTEVDMGSPEAATPADSDGACYTQSSGLPALARQNRMVMIEALTAVGTVNYPTEWWHWSYGDRYLGPGNGSDRRRLRPTATRPRAPSGDHPQGSVGGPARSRQHRSDD